MTISLAKNSVIEQLPTQDGEKSILERVLWVDLPCDVVFVIRIHDKSALPQQKLYSETIRSIHFENTLLLTTDPHANLKGLPQQFIDSHSKLSNRRYEIVSPLALNAPDIFDPKERGRMIDKAIQDHCVTKPYLYKQLRRFWQRGMCLEALYPDFYNYGAPNKEKKCRLWDDCENGKVCASGLSCPHEAKRGRPKKLIMLNPTYVGVNVSEADRKIFEVAIRLYFCSTDDYPLKKAYDEMISKHYANGEKTELGKMVPALPPAHQYPTYEQLRYWHSKKLNLTAELIARKGLRKHDMDHRPLLGNSTAMAFGPGSIFMIDATIGDITLVSQLTRKIIGRPIIYFIIDVFSRMVVGFHICLKGPSWAGSAIAIANAATDKVQFCARYGIAIEAWEWPCHHVGESYQADRGEMICDASDRLVIFYNLSIANCPPYRPDWKGIVERYFRTTNETVLHWLPGDTLKRDFGNPDNRLNATLDIKQLNKLIIISILEHNKYHWNEDYPMERDMIASGVRPVPMELWKWGIENRVGRLREESRESLICNLLPRSTATVTKNGVRSGFGLHYITSQVTDLQWFERARTSGTWHVDMAVNPTEIGEAYLIANNGMVTPCSLLPRDERFSGLCSEELEEHNAILGLKGDLHKGVRQQGCSDRISLSESVIAEAEALTKMARELDPPKSARSSLQGIRDNRSAENDSLAHEAFLQDGIIPAPSASQPSKEQPEQAVANSRPSFMDEVLNTIIAKCEVPK